MMNTYISQPFIAQLHIYIIIYILEPKKEWNLPICDNTVDTEGIILREISQTRKDTYHKIVPYGIFLKTS